MDPIEYSGYARFFRNRREDAATGLFDEAGIMALNVIGIDGMLFPDATPDIMNACKKICELQRYAQKAEGDTNIYMRDIDDI